MPFKHLTSTSCSHTLYINVHEVSTWRFLVSGCDVHHVDSYNNLSKLLLNPAEAAEARNELAAAGRAHKYAKYYMKYEW